MITPIASRSLPTDSRVDHGTFVMSGSAVMSDTDAASGGAAIALDSELNAYIEGATGPGLPVWSSGFQRTYGGGDWDACVAKLNATGTILIWSTYLGCSGEDQVTGLALDQQRQVYVHGQIRFAGLPPEGCDPRLCSQVPRR